MDREEAIRRIKEWNLDSDDREVLAVIIPELKESEDERIREFLIQHISEWIGCIEHDLKISSKDIKSEKELAMFKAGLSWLERQKENTWSEEDDAKVKAMCKEGDLKPTERAWLKNLRNRVWKEPQHAIRATKGFGDPDGPQFELVDLPEEQKPEWSEEDEKNLKSVVGTLWFALNTPHFPLNYERIIELEGWLKSLRPQPRQEWSEEDEKMLTGIIERGSSQIPSHEPALREDQMEWLMKRLRFLRPSWKPGKEHMDALERCIDYLDESDNDDFRIMLTLYEQLVSLEASKLEPF